MKIVIEMDINLYIYINLRNLLSENYFLLSKICDITEMVILILLYTNLYNLLSKIIFFIQNL